MSTGNDGVQRHIPMGVPGCHGNAKDALNEKEHQRANTSLTARMATGSDVTRQSPATQE